MNRIYKTLGVALPMALLFGCSSDKMVEETFSATSIEDAQGPVERCASMKVLEEKLKENPGMIKKMEAIEAHTRKFEESMKATGNGKKPGTGGGGTGGDGTSTTGTINIPVVVNVIYNVNNPKENISEAQIQSQLDVLTADFTKANSDINKTTAFST